MPLMSTILIIDDEPNLRRSLSLILMREGYQVTCAASAQEALQLLQAGSYDLVFLDLKMPDRDGMSILPEMRRRYPDMPVVILTAHATLNSAMEAVRQGAREYLLKPIQPDRILERTREILSQQEQPARRREILSQMQTLLGELHQIDGATEFNQSVNVATMDAARYLRHGPLTLDLNTQDVLLEDQERITIAPSTFKYLVTLVRHAPHPVSFETLVKESQGYDLSRAEARDLVRGHIHILRKALEPQPSHPRYLITVRDVGYRLVA